MCTTICRNCSGTSCSNAPAIEIEEDVDEEVTEAEDVDDEDLVDEEGLEAEEQGTEPGAAQGFSEVGEPHPGPSKRIKL
jgi:hypothetical protein